ncbi:hypothetical protein IWQ60_010692 [Tieghemiomyces parasiticus]|uniref:Pinin/SDK/MemA protein domain-containing protein n=1 Tax=Tieghemiomyces parasiticus TaxID=78921 RepID=A0A9W7ZKG5_9FUNG|nr:hypothetical protein IWQ60_010692 [Tieghemiomyces parasiticus]
MQPSDAEAGQRGKRMFGRLLGTLKTFQSEAEQATDRERKRQRRERELHERLHKERAEAHGDSRESRRHRNSAGDQADDHSNPQPSPEMACQGYKKTRTQPHLYYRRASAIPSTSNRDSRIDRAHEMETD